MEPFAKFPEKSSKGGTFQAVFYSGLHFPWPLAVSYKYNKPKVAGKHMYQGLLRASGLLEGKTMRGEGKAKASLSSSRLWPHCLSKLF